MNWLFLFIPVTLVLERLHLPDPWVFFSAALAQSRPPVSRALDAVARTPATPSAGCSTRASATPQS